VGENIQDSSDWQQIHLEFPWKEKEIEVLSQDEQTLRKNHER